MSATNEMMRSATALNHYQGDFPRVLCVCSGGLLRSPTLAWVLSNAPYNCNTRAAGSHHEYALVPVDQVLLNWARYVVFVNTENLDRTLEMKLRVPNSRFVLDIPDRYAFRDTKLIEAMRAALKAHDFPTYEPRP